MAENQELLQKIFGIQLDEQPDITRLRQFHSDTAYCTNDDGQIIGIAVVDRGEELQEIRLRGTDFPELMYLNLSGNEHLQKLELIGAFPSLIHFDASATGVKSFQVPQVCPALAWLDFSRSKLEKFIFPGSYPNLEHLDLADNSLHQFIVHDLRKMPKLERIYLKENPLPDLLRKSVERRANCLWELQRIAREFGKGEAENKTYKVILIGNGGVGKTRLAERLIHDTFEEHWRSTQGISLLRYQDDDFPYILNIWDFGGQEIYHATHRLFMQAGAVYLALWDESSPECLQVPEEANPGDFPLAYWLHYARARGEESPILVIKTKCQENPNPHPQQAELRERYGVKDFLTIDSKPDDPYENRFSILKSTLAGLINNLGGTYKIPQNYADLREHLQLLLQSGQKAISMDDFLDYCDDLDIEEPQKVLEDWLVTSGEVFYRSGYFGNLILLDQSWAIDAIYALLERDEAGYPKHFRSAMRGVFDVPMLDRIWAGRNYSRAEQELLVDFMLSCELCFEKRDTDQGGYISFEKKQFVVPQMMDPEPPSLVPYFLEKAQENNFVHLQYEDDFLHRGVLERFIVRTQALADFRDIWQKGIFIKDGQAEALVRIEQTVIDGHNKEVIHVVADPETEKMLQKIRNTLEELYQAEVKEWWSLDGENYVSAEKLAEWPEDKIPDRDGTTVLPVQDFLVFRGEKLSTTYQAEAEDTQSEAMLLQLEKEQLIAADDLDDVGMMPKVQDKPLKILLVAANPTLKNIQYTKEWDFLEGKLSNLYPMDADEHYKINRVSQCTFDELLDKLDDHHPNILHFSGHGTEGEFLENGGRVMDAGLLFHHDDQNREDTVTAEEWERQLKMQRSDLGQDQLQLVLLNACYSQEQAMAISRSGIFAVGTKDRISNAEAIKFAGGFYRKLCKTGDVLAAVNQGKSRAIRYDEDITKLIHLFYNGQRIPLKKK